MTIKFVVALELMIGLATFVVQPDTAGHLQFDYNLRIALDTLKLLLLRDESLAN